MLRSSRLACGARTNRSQKQELEVDVSADIDICAVGKSCSPRHSPPRTSRWQCTQAGMQEDDPSKALICLPRTHETGFRSRYSYPLPSLSMRSEQDWGIKKEVFRDHPRACRSRSLFDYASYGFCGLLCSALFSTQEKLGMNGISCCDRRYELVCWK